MNESRIAMSFAFTTSSHVFVVLSYLRKPANRLAPQPATHRLYPMRELLGDLLLGAGRPKEAAAEYARALKLTPNRYRGLLGAARAAEALGDTATARAYYTRVIELSEHADSMRPELQRARSYVERR